MYGYGVQHPLALQQTITSSIICKGLNLEDLDPKQKTESSDVSQGNGGRYVATIHANHWKQEGLLQHTFNLLRIFPEILHQFLEILNTWK
jgi:hypothetical protein